MGEKFIAVIHGIDLQIQQGEFVSIVGPSGAGKSTLMNIIGLLDKPSSGEYFLNNCPTASLSLHHQAKLRNKEIGFVFQSFYLLEKLTAWQNVALPLFYRHLNQTLAKQKALDMLDNVGLKQFANHKPNELSGGQQQRVAIARALIGDPNLILADEPTGALDSKTGQHIMAMLLEINRQQNKTIIIVTHDEQIAKQCSRMITLKDGRVVEPGI